MSLTNTLYRAVTQLFLPCLALGLVGSAPAFAAQSYDVEIVVFAYRHPVNDGEQWPTPLPAETGPASIYSSDLARELPVGAYRLNGISNGLRQSSAYAVLFHKAWRQPAYDSANAVGFPVYTAAGNSANSIEGSVRLIRERFLHLDADLLMVSGNSRNAVVDINAPYTSPQFELREKRRINSNVVYYFDHPHFGMLAMVTPYVSPEEAQQAIEEGIQEESQELTPATEPLPADDQLTR
jgi:hypothetical protein